MKYITVLVCRFVFFPKSHILFGNAEPSRMRYHQSSAPCPSRPFPLASGIRRLRRSGWRTASKISSWAGNFWISEKMQDSWFFAELGVFFFWPLLFDKYKFPTSGPVEVLLLSICSGCWVSLSGSGSGVSCLAEPKAGTDLEGNLGSLRLGPESQVWWPWTGLEDHLELQCRHRGGCSGHWNRHWKCAHRWCLGWTLLESPWTSWPVRQGCFKGQHHPPDAG